MELIKIKNLVELRRALKSSDDDALFRGQVRQYGSDQFPRMNTSFSRQGCIPPLMLRWSHYSRFILAALLGWHEKEVGLEFTQAVLQHYGWRSFYLDASSDSAVGAWFAAHTFSSKRGVEMCEDCFEQGVLLTKLYAGYDYSDGDGNLYVLSKSALQQHELKTFDLSAINVPEGRPRFKAQNAWLVGPLHGDLPVDCIKATIQGPREVFRDFAASSKLTSTSSLFPPANEDPVLYFLLSTPWKLVSDKTESKPKIEIFQQALELPQYDNSFKKHNPPHVAFYRNEMASSSSADKNITFFNASDEIVTGSNRPETLRFPRISTLLQKYKGHLIFEIDNLVRRPGDLSSDYVKGIAIHLCKDGKVGLADFAMDHPGLQVAGYSINSAWYYKIDSTGKWSRVSTEGDCPCENDSIHEHHLSGLAIIESLLTDSASIKIVERESNQISQSN